MTTPRYNDLEYSNALYLPFLSLSFLPSFWIGCGNRVERLGKPKGGAREERTEGSCQGVKYSSLLRKGLRSRCNSIAFDGGGWEGEEPL